MKLLYLCFWEDRDIYYQTFLSIASALAFYAPQDIVVYSQNIKYFNIIEWLTTVKISKETINDWLGDMKYDYRLKICCIKDALQAYSQSIIFVDSDTFIKSKIPAVSQWTSILHLKEAKFDPTYLSIGDNFDKAWFGGKLLGECYMYNSWVIGVAFEDSHLIDKSLELLDTLLIKNSKINIHIREQITLSYVLQNLSNLKESYNEVFHYRPNKAVSKSKWKNFTDDLRNIFWDTDDVKFDFSLFCISIQKANFADHLCQIWSLRYLK